MKRLLILSFALLALNGCAAQYAERFCTGIGIAKDDPRYQECAMRYLEARNQGGGRDDGGAALMNHGATLMQLGQPRTLGGPTVTCHKVGTMTQCY